MNKLFGSILWFIGRCWSYLYSYSLKGQFTAIKNKVYTSWLSREIKVIGISAILVYPIDLVGGKYITIGNGSSIGKRTFLTAWDRRGAQRFTPQISIGNNVYLGEDSHITAINKIIIGNDVLFGKKITITDNSHGETTIDSLKFPPRNRLMHSSGPVIIEDGAWIGDKVTILPNVIIGKNAIIGANSVVTKDIPANCVAAGVPARVIKEMKN